MRVNLERLFYWIVLMFFASVMLLSAFAITQDHQVQYWYLSDVEGKLYIKGEVNWAPDEDLVLDRSISYEEALCIIDRMNAQLND